MYDTRRMARKLGIYLFVIAWHQLIFYLLWISVDGPDWLYILDPRLGAQLLESTLLDVEPGFPGILCWAFALILLIIASCLMITGRGLKLYLVIESFFAVPTIFALVWVVIARFGSPQGFPFIKVMPPLVVFLVYSVLPYGTAVRILAGSPMDLSILPGRAVSDTEQTFR